MTNPRLKCHTRAQPECDIFNRGSSYFNIPRTTVSYVFLYGQLQESWIISGLQWWNINEYHLPSKNVHSPNYCSWLAVCVNYSANFYCKITLINRFKLYLIKTYSKTPKNKQNVNKNNVEYMLCLHLVNITWRHPGWHYNVIIMSPRVTVKQWTYDNAQRHVTAFRPISEAAHSWSYDSISCAVCVYCRSGVLS